MDMYQSNLHNDAYESQVTILEKQIDILHTMNDNQDILIMKLADELIKTKRIVGVSSFFDRYCSSFEHSRYPCMYCM